MMASTRCIIVEAEAVVDLRATLEVTTVAADEVETVAVVDVGASVESAADLAADSGEVVDEAILNTRRPTNELLASITVG